MSKLAPHRRCPQILPFQWYLYTSFRPKIRRSCCCFRATTQLCRVVPRMCLNVHNGNRQHMKVSLQSLTALRKPLKTLPSAVQPQPERAQPELTFFLGLFSRVPFTVTVTAPTPQQSYCRYSTPTHSQRQSQRRLSAPFHSSLFVLRHPVCVCVTVCTCATSSLPTPPLFLSIASGGKARGACAKACTDPCGRSTAKTPL